MEDSVSRKLRLAYEKYLEVFLSAKPTKMAELAGGKRVGNDIIISHFGEEIAVDVTTGQMKSKPKQLLEEILILKYLTEAQGVVGPGNDYLAFIQLPFGSHHIKAFQAEVTDFLADKFGGDFAAFAAAAEALGGVKATAGDIAYVLPFFPKIYVKIILWVADDEFPAAANFLFDNKCSFHLDTDGLNELANATALRLAEEAKK